MANLIVRNIEEEIVKALKSRSGKHGISAEEEHRRILRRALLEPRQKSFAEAIASMPDVGTDEDFARVQGEDPSDVFD